MKIQHFKKYLFLLTVALALTAAARAQTTAFNYQGKLTDAGSAANGTFQMQFKLFDAAAGGTQLGSTVENPSVAVAQGVFAVKLDFGANAFTGANRFLEIAVRRNAGESYTTLAPREQIAASPYAVRTLSAQTADVALDSQKLGGIAASEYVTTSSVGSQFIRNQTDQQTANFNVSGNGVIGGAVGIGTNPSNYRLDVLGYVRARNTESTGFAAETTGTTNAWARFYMRTSNRGWLIGTSQNFNGDQFYLVDENVGQSRMTIQPNGGAIAFPSGNVGMGTTTPNTRLTLTGGAPWTSAGWTASMNMQNASALGWEANASGQRFGIGQSGGGLYFFRTTSAFGSGATAANYDLTITDTGNVGIGTSTPNARLSVNGNATQDVNSFGLPKAMVFVLGNGTISRCYNATTGVSMTGGTTNSGCGFTASQGNFTGTYTVNFGFSTTSRFFSLVTYGGSNNKGSYIPGASGTTVSVFTFLNDQGNLNGVVSDFFLIVY